MKMSDSFSFQAIYNHTDEDGGFELLIGKHGCESDLTEAQKYDYECEKAQDTGEACKDFDYASLPDGHEENQLRATVCFCDKDRWVISQKSLPYPAV